jgi:hypothetical protein
MKFIAHGNLRDRDVGFLLVAYFMTDVERALKFRIYGDELFRLKLYNKYQERSDALIEDLFGSWADLDADFTRFDIPPRRVGLGTRRRHPPIVRLAK